MPHETCRIAVVMPAYNEASNLPHVLKRLREVAQDATGCLVDAIVVDDHSSDDTAAVARANGAVVLTMPFNFGAWTAAQTGLRYAFRHGYDLAVTMDSDGQHLPESLGDIVGPVRAGEADVVIGACVDRASPARRIAWRYLRLLSGLDIADLTSGFRAYSRRAVAIVASRAATGFDYQDVGLLLLLRRRRMRVVERNVAMAPRRDGKSRVFASWWHVARYMAVSSVLSASKRNRRKHAS